LLSIKKTKSKMDEKKKKSKEKVDEKKEKSQMKTDEKKENSSKSEFKHAVQINGSKQALLDDFLSQLKVSDENREKLAKLVEIVDSLLLAQESGEMKSELEKDVIAALDVIEKAIDALIKIITFVSKLVPPVGVALPILSLAAAGVNALKENPKPVVKAIEIVQSIKKTFDDFISYISNMLQNGMKVIENAVNQVLQS